MKYSGKCGAQSIVVYYNIKRDKIFCSFKNVEIGDILTCKSSKYDTFNENTYIRIYFDDDDCDDSNDRRRLRKKSSDSESESESSDSSGDDYQCLALFDTDCSSNIVGTQSKGCTILTVVSFTDANGQFCDKIQRDSSDSSDAKRYDSSEDLWDNALINEKETSNNKPLQIFDELDPLTKWTLMCIFVVFTILMCVAFCICFVQKMKRSKDIKNDEFPQRRKHMHVNSISIAQFDNDELEGSYFNEDRCTTHIKSVEDDFLKETVFEDEYYIESENDLSIQCSAGKNDTKSRKSFIQMIKTVRD